MEVAAAAGEPHSLHPSKPWPRTRLLPQVPRLGLVSPQELPRLHGYVDETLALKPTLKDNLRKLTPAQFERVLHPVFEEDELTLVIVGAVLGSRCPRPGCTERDAPEQSDRRRRRAVLATG